MEFLDESTRPLFTIRTIGGRPYLIQNDAIWKQEKRQVLPFNKPPGVRRILIAGESSADMLGAALQQEIKRGPSPHNYQVLNCAIGGADLELAERRFDECMGYAPDAIIFLFGHNLYYSYPDASPLLLRLILWARKSALVSYLNIFRPGQDYADAKRWLDLENFIDRMSSEARARGLPLMLATVPSNLWVEPKPGFGDDTAPAYLEARYEYASGLHRQAIALLGHAVENKPSALWHFTLGAWLYREAAWRKAYSQLILARDLDPARMRASTAVNNLIRRAAVRDGTMLLDAEQIIEDQSPHGIPGWGNFFDSQHVTNTNFHELAYLSARQFMEKGWRGLVPKSYGPLRDSYGPPPTSLIIANASRVSPWPLPKGWWGMSYLYGHCLPELQKKSGSIFARAFQNPKDRSAAYLGLAQALWRAGYDAEARAANQKAGEIFPQWADPFIQLGLFDIQERHRQAALADFRKALKKNPHDPRGIFFIHRIEGVPYASLRGGTAGDKLSHVSH